MIRDNRDNQETRGLETGRRLFARELLRYASIDAVASDVQAYLDEYWESVAENE